MLKLNVVRAGGAGGVWGDVGGGLPPRFPLDLGFGGVDVVGTSAVACSRSLARLARYCIGGSVLAGSARVRARSLPVGGWVGIGRSGVGD